MSPYLAAILILAAAPPSPVATGAAAVEELRRQKSQLEADLARPVTLAPEVAAIADELPRLKAAAERVPSADTLIAYARALMASRRFLEARAAAEHAAALSPSHAEARLTAEHLRRFDGANGEAVVVALESARRQLERDDEVAEARRTLPGLAEQAKASPSVATHLEHAAARVVLEQWAEAAEAARRAQALDPKSALAEMLLTELAAAKTRPGAVVRERITARWAGILTGKDPLAKPR